MKVSVRSRSTHRARYETPAWPGLCAGTLSRYGWFLQLRDLFHHHLDPEWMRNPLLPDPVDSRFCCRLDWLATRHRLCGHRRAGHGRTGLGIPDGRRSLLLVIQDWLQGARWTCLGLVYRLV